MTRRCHPLDPVALEIEVDVRSCVELELAAVAAAGGDLA